MIEGCDGLVIAYVLPSSARMENKNVDDRYSKLCKERSIESILSCYNAHLSLRSKLNARANNTVRSMQHINPNIISSAAIPSNL